MPWLWLLGGLFLGGVVVRRWWFWQARPMLAYPDDRLVCWGHRGMPSAAPENTLASFEAAIAAGVDGIELDVMATADGVLVVRHDFDLERVSDGVGLVEDVTYAQLARLNAAHRWPDDAPPQAIPRLEDALEMLPDSLLINIELKAQRWRSVGLEEKVIEQVRRFGLLERTIVSSFNPNWLLTVRRLEPRLALGYLWWDVDVPWFLARPNFFNLVRPEFLHPSADLVTADVVRRAHRRGVKVNAWTVNNGPLVARLKSLGVDGIFTDYPALVRAANRA